MYDNPVIQYAILTMITAGTSVAVLLFTFWSKRLSLMIRNLDLMTASTNDIKMRVDTAAIDAAVMHNKMDAQAIATSQIAMTATQTETLINSRHSQLVQDMAELRKDLQAAKLATEVALKQAADARLAQAERQAAIADERLARQAPQPEEMVRVQPPVNPVPVNIDPHERGKP